MKKMTVLASIGVFMAGVHLAVAAQDIPSAAPQSDGVLYLAEKLNQAGVPEGKTCSINIGEGKFNLEDTDCKNDEVSYYRLDSMRSGTLISFDAKKNCKSKSDDGTGLLDPGSWKFTVRTFGGPVNSEWKRIRDLNGLNPETVISEWVWLEGGFFVKGNIDGKLSCVEILR